MLAMAGQELFTTLEVLVQLVQMDLLFHNGLTLKLVMCLHTESHEAQEFHNNMKEDLKRSFFIAKIAYEIDFFGLFASFFT